MSIFPLETLGGLTLSTGCPNRASPLFDVPSMIFVFSLSLNSASGTSGMLGTKTITSTSYSTYIYIYI